MFKEYGATEIAFPVFLPGEDAQSMRCIVKRSRQRRKAGKATEGAVSCPLSGVMSRLRCASIAAQDLPYQRTRNNVSVTPYSLNML